MTDWKQTFAGKVSNLEADTKLQTKSHVEIQQIVVRQHKVQEATKKALVGKKKALGVGI